MYQPPEASGYRPLIDGVTMKTLVSGEKTLLAEFRLQQGADLPRHSHPHEQTGYLLSGCLELTIGEATHRVEPGGAWTIPGGTPHRAVAITDCVAVEVFAPVREDYLPGHAAGSARGKQG